MNFFVFLFLLLTQARSQKANARQKLTVRAKAKSQPEAKCRQKPTKKNNANQRPPGFLVGKEGINQGRKEVIKEGKEEGRNEGRMASCAGTVPKSGRGGAAPSPLKSGTFYTTVGTARASF